MSMVYSGDSIQDTDGGVLRPISSVMRNRIINGAMVISQRNAGASFTPVNSGYGLDRWRYQLTQPSKITSQQSSVAPAGFTNSLLVTSSSAYTVLSAEQFVIRQRIEGFNVADLGFGTANAKTITLSFWVRSSLTGTFGGSVTNSAEDRAYPFSFTISAANTFEYKTVTIAGDTSGIWLTTNGTGLSLNFGLGVGSTYSGTAGAWAAGYFGSATGATSVVGTSGATFYITGVQLEVGTQATSFEYRQYQQELALCQRYYFRYKAVGTADNFGTGFANSSTQAIIVYPFKVSMRTNPTALETSGTSTDYRLYASNGTAINCNAVPAFGSASTEVSISIYTVASGLTAGNGTASISASGANGFLAWSAEL